MENPVDDDPQTWPDDPYELFGVPRDVDARALRLAYNQLVRRFNPERFPQQFQHIREQYEWLQRAIEWRSVEFALTEDDQESLKIFLQAEPSTQQPSDKTSSGPHPSATASQKFIPPAIAWQHARQGDFATAYRAFEELAERKPIDDTIGLPLYWLLRIRPELDSDRVAADWLIRIIRQQGTESSAWGLYLQVLALDADEALSHRCAQLLQELKNFDTRYALVSRRWQMAADAERWDVVRDDLEHLRVNVPIDDHRSWPSFRLLACDYAAWSFHPDARDLFEAGERELSQLTYPAHDSIAAYDRYELLAETTAWFRKPAAVRSYLNTHRLLNLLRIFWMKPASQFRLAIQKLVHVWVDTPVHALEVLDHFSRNFPFELGVLCKHLEDLADEVEWSSHEDHESRQPMIREALQLMSNKSREVFRQDILAFAITEAVRIEEIVTVGQAGGWRGTVEWYCKELRNDFTLRTLVAAHTVYWDN